MSLMDQMLKAGLIDEKQAKKTSHKHRQGKKHNPPNLEAQKKEQARLEAQKQAEAQKERDRQLNKQRDEAQNARATGKDKSPQEQLRISVFREGLLKNADGPKRYHFTEAGRVEFIQVSDVVARKLEAGQAAIARKPGAGQQYAVITQSAAEQLHETAPELLIAFHR